MPKKLLPFVATLVLLSIGLIMRWPTVGYDGPATQEALKGYLVDRFAYSDIALLYYRNNPDEHPLPYFDYSLEYPVGTGLLIYLLSLVTHNMPQNFLLTWLAMSVCALVIAALVPRFPDSRVWLFALAPALALYVNLNWDMWGVLLTVVALLLFVRGRDDLGAALLAAAVWTKFFPIVFVPFLVLDRLRLHGKRAAMRVVAVFAIASAVINAPVLLLVPREWWLFFAANAARAREWNLWILFDPSFLESSWLSTDQINRLSALLLLCGIVVLLMLQWRSSPRVEGLSPTWLPACCAALAWFLFVSKVYSPQYSLWIVALLAVVGASSALAVAWSAADLIFFGVVFVWLELVTRYWEVDAHEWFWDYAFRPAIALRETMLLVVVGWCVKQMSTRAGPWRESTK